MSALTSSNVVPLRVPRGSGGSERLARTTVLHAVADDDGLVEIAPVVAALECRRCFRQIVVHAGANAELPALPADAELVGVDHRLGIDFASHAERTAAALTAFDAVLREEHPDLVVVAGEDDAAVAAALAAAKRRIAVAHLGAGLRSWDWTLPDEINRTMIDRLSDTLFTFSDDAAANLRAEGVPDGRIHPVGNTRVDLLRRYEERARAAAAWEAHGIREREYTLVTLQRPDTVEPPERLERIVAALAELATAGPVLLLHHERTRAILGDLVAAAGLRPIEQAGYLATLSLVAGAGAIITDSGAVQEDASALGVRCFTPLATTSRGVTLTHGTNVLLGDDPAAIASARRSGWAPTPAAIPMWDGRAGDRVADAVVANYTLASAFAEDR